MTWHIQLTGLHFPAFNEKALEEEQNQLEEMNCSPSLQILTKWTWISPLASLGFRLCTYKIRFLLFHRSNRKCNMKVKDSDTSPTCLRSCISTKYYVNVNTVKKKNGVRSKLNMEIHFYGFSWPSSFLIATLNWKLLAILQTTTTVNKSSR